MITFIVFRQRIVKVLPTRNANMLLLVLWLTVAITNVAPAPASKSNSTHANVLTKPNVPPVVTQCFYEARWFPAGSIVNAGRAGDWCFGSYCDIDGHVKHWDDFNCPPPDRNNPNPPFPDLNKLKKQTTTTVRPTRPPTVAPPTAPPTTPSTFWFPRTTVPQPFDFNFNQMGCYYRGQFYWAGQDIENKRRGRRCMGVYCDFNGVLQNWNDDCRFTIPPPTVPRPTRPPRRRQRPTPMET